MNKKQQTIDSYNKHAKDFDKKFGGIRPRVKDIEKVFSCIKKDNPKVIEIGCSNGRDASEIIKRTNNYLGTDISKELIAIARKNVPSAKFKVIDLEDLELPKNTDIVYSFASLLHVDKEGFKKTLDSYWEKISDNGVIFISLKYCDKYKEKTTTTKFGTRTYYLYNPETLENIIGNKYTFVWKSVFDFNNQTWFDFILRKKTI